MIGLGVKLPLRSVAPRFQAATVSPQRRWPRHNSRRHVRHTRDGGHVDNRKQNASHRSTELHGRLTTNHCGVKKHLPATRQRLLALTTKSSWTYTNPPNVRHTKGATYDPAATG